MAFPLLVAFIVVPLVELWVITRVADGIGWGTTLVAVFAVSLAGALLVKREGAQTWRRFRQALAQARVPAGEVVDGALVLVGGALLLTPGFVTDVVGLLFVAPPTRALINRALRARVRAAFGLPAPRRRQPRGSEGDGKPIDVEVVRVERAEPSNDPPRLPQDRPD